MTKLSAMELREKWAISLGIHSFVILLNGKHVGTVIFKTPHSNNNVHVAALSVVDGCYKQFTSIVKGHGFDRYTAALGGWKIQPDEEPLSDQGETWQRQLEHRGYEVICVM
jgi:hypothetical protein